MINGYRDLAVWQKSMALAERVYAITEELPSREMYGLASQLRRAATSIPSNIAEGKGVSGKNFARHLKIAIGSEAELQTQIELARRLRFISDQKAAAITVDASEVGKMLRGLLKALPAE